MSLLKLLSSSNYIVVNKELLNLLGLDCAFMLGELCSEHNYFEEYNLLDEEGYFYSTVKNIESRTMFAEHKQRIIFKNLKGMGIIDYKQKGIPSKRYIKINEDKIYEVLGLGTRVDNLSAMESTNSRNFYISLYNKECLKKEIKEEEINIMPEKTSQQSKYDEILNHLNEKTGKHFRLTAKFKTLVNARMREGYTLEDFNYVIDVMHANWKGTKYESYLQPSTLFGTKFDQYLNRQMPLVIQDGNKKEMTLPKHYTQNEEEIEKIAESELQAESIDIEDLESRIKRRN